MTEFMARVSGQISGMIFLATVCFFLLLGIGRKYLKRGARKALALFIATGVITNIIMNIFYNVYVIDYMILMLSIILPLGLFYSNEPKYLFLHWFKVASLLIVLKLIYEFIRYQIFTGIFFKFYSLTLQTSLTTYLEYLTFLLIASFVFWKYIGKFYEPSNETKNLKLKEYFQRFLKGELEYESN